MVNFDFTEVFFLLSQLRAVISRAYRNTEFVEQNGGYNDPRVQDDPGLPVVLDQFTETCKWCSERSKQLFSHLKCAHIDRAAAQLEYWPRSDPLTWAELRRRAIALRDAIETELRQYLFYQYSKDKGDKLKRWNTEWKTVLTAFPHKELEWDVFSATDCYALGHNTASVFHSMRVVEIGLRAIAKERGLKLPKDKAVEWATWQEIITALEHEIKAIGLKRAGKAKDAALEFYSGARADLNGFKDEYRNQVTHVRKMYDEFQAIRALTNVHAFMGRVSARIDHTHKPIEWGF